MMRNNSKKYVFGLLYALIGIFTILYIRHNWGYAVDDSYITFRYADNLRAGYGLRFNVAEQFYGTTAAGYALLVCALSFVVDPFLKLFGAAQFIGAGHTSIPVAGTVLSALSIGGICVTMVRLVQLRACNPPGILLAVLSTVVTFTCLASNIVSSHETYTFLFVALASTYAYLIARRPITSAVLMALACSIRPDTVLIAGMLFVVAVGIALRRHETSLLGRLRGPLKYALCLGLLMVLWLFYARWNFGAFSPETLIAKKAQMLLRDFPGFDLKNLKAQMLIYGGQFVVALGALAILSYAAIFASAKQGNSIKNADLILLGLIWTGYAIGDTSAYLIFNVSIWSWYVIAIMFSGAFAVFAFAIAAIGDGWALGAPGRRVVSVATALGVMLVVFGWKNAPASVEHWFTVRNVNDHITSYVPAADFIRKENPNGTTIITCEPGAFAFRLGPKYEVVDELGLVSPGVAREIVKGDMDYPFKRWRPKYIIISWHGLYTPEGRSWLDRDYTQVLSFDGPWWKSFGITARVLQRKQNAS
ncbi:hypothetical protein N0A02_18290 [Paraburkholderia acidicola]|uniref:Glycosyltransferase RgtA/B/C/D-like domain-containing protein n=1 Tax=Paraburkholderia acidicola TaxID=1912599 RepID=A0ABV1LQ45_9BURK